MKSSFINIILDTLVIQISGKGEFMKECPICYCSINNKDCKLDCGHCFHKECLLEYYKNKNYNNTADSIVLDCPYCRHKILEF